ncbi:MAG: bacillithiol system redox-active protein YtxJ [Gemmatimonadetes bacterium]|nr:bacillithiol system redox-active protein YtxJ [Gemmatimonadota bacterium]NIQ56875.1 bacillithiol system redox-active protein YtxJ [Gemmatimonadota bacterium]NIU77054.1 bacillithiol system redox-active protein YtxJ [Gammaproteobacteria bacterium]NIX46397.1 bacillithiol system redox-active protein YtxJ [Gemmatimonadota bacterium]NIY10705.1 bacillithiol system redox-active protein YtxJ [Gemmatimonadota bacterium]
MSRAPTIIRDADALEAVLEEPLAVLYKHSPLCGLSAIAARQVREFMAARPDVPVYHLDVVRDRDLSRAVERRLDTRHESPQALVLRRGEVAWAGSHRSVTADALERASATGPAPGSGPTP